jgi:anti-sigma B factor antagonist
MLADIRFEPFGAGIVARISGEVDMSNADKIESALRQVVTNDALGLVLDLAEVEYFDSAGIHLVYGLREDLRVRGQQLRLVVPERSPVRDTLTLAGVLHALDVSVDVESATAAVAGRA